MAQAAIAAVASPSPERSAQEIAEKKCLRGRVTSERLTIAAYKEARSLREFGLFINSLSDEAAKLFLANATYRPSYNPEKIIVEENPKATLWALYRARAARIRRALAVAVGLLHCSSKENTWVAEDLQNADGELFDGWGKYWQCRRRLCPACQASMRRRARAKLLLAVEGYRQLVGCRWRFLTFTAPKHPLLSLTETLNVYQAAWRLMTNKRPYWAANVMGGVKGVEFTLHQGEAGYHVHIHCLVSSKFLNQAELRTEWTHCIQAAWRKAGVQEMTINTDDGLAFVWIELVKNKQDAGKELSNEKPTKDLEDAVREVCKYVAKDAVWDTLPDDELLDAATVERWPRSFELFGELALNKRANEGLKELKRLGVEIEDVPKARALLLAELKKPRKDRNSPLKPFLDTPRLFDRPVEMGKPDHTEARIVASPKMARFMALVRNPDDEWRNYQLQLPASKDSPEWVREKDNKLFNKTLAEAKEYRVRPSWLSLATSMEWAEFQDELWHRTRRAMGFREQQLARKYPLAKFRTL